MQLAVDAVVSCFFYTYGALAFQSATLGPEVQLAQAMSEYEAILLDDQRAKTPYTPRPITANSDSRSAAYKGDR